MFLSYQAHERHKNADTLIAGAREMLSDAAVRGSVDNASELLAIVESYYVPNFRDGKISLPRSYQNAPDKLPLMPLHHSETVEMGQPFTTQTSSQKATMIEYLGAQGIFSDAIDDTVSQLETNGNKISFNFKRNRSPLAMASTLTGGGGSVSYAPEEGATLRVSLRTRPVTLYRRSLVDKDTSGNITPSVSLVHEAVHAHQLLREPAFAITGIDRRDADEAEAVGVEKIFAAMAIAQRVA